LQERVMTSGLSMTTWEDPVRDLVGKVVVLDTQGPLIYIGTLAQVTEAFYVLMEADVHDSNDSRASKDLYVVEARDLGVRVNRKRVLVMRAQVASASLLADVVD
jgi:hypothetical protein